MGSNPTLVILFHCFCIPIFQNSKLNLPGLQRAAERGEEEQGVEYYGLLPLALERNLRSHARCRLDPDLCVKMKRGGQADPGSAGYGRVANGRLSELPRGGAVVEVYTVKFYWP